LAILSTSLKTSSGRRREIVVIDVILTVFQIVS
jgi:hypothetical protein